MAGSGEQLPSILVAVIGVPLMIAALAFWVWLLGRHEPKLLWGMRWLGLVGMTFFTPVIICYVLFYLLLRKAGVMMGKQDAPGWFWPLGIAFVFFSFAAVYAVSRRLMRHSAEQANKQDDDRS